MPVINGQAVSAEITNPAFIDAQIDDTALGIISFHNTALASGSFVENLQAAVNTNLIATGAIETDFTVAVTYGAPASTIVDGTSHKQALQALAAKFHPSTGHKHTGSPGDGPPVASGSISSVPLQGYVKKATDLTGITGSSTDVSTFFVGATPSSNTTTEGVVVNVPYNKVVIRQASGINTDDEYKDVNGNIVYGRLTFAASVWTLSFYVELSAVETVYSFASPSDIRWYYQELFNPLSTINPPPTYSQFAFIPSDAETASEVGYQEVPAGTVNGINTVFGPLTFQPVDSNSAIVFVDFLAVSKTGYVLSGSTITFNAGFIPASGQSVYVFYLTGGAPTLPPAPSGNFNVEYRTLTGGEIALKQIVLTMTPANGSQVLLDQIGGTSQEYGVDFTVSGSTLGWNGLGLDGFLSAGDKLRVVYIS